MRAVLIPVLTLLLSACEPYPRAVDTGAWEGSVSQYPGFYWLIEDQIAGMPRPGADVEVELAWLRRDAGLALLVSANLYPPDPSLVDAAGLDHLHLPIEDFTAPTQGQLHEFAQAVEARVDAGQRVGVHCDAGLGRTGTLLAAWLVWTGTDAEAAIDAVREARPGSIETLEQEDAIREFALSL